VFPEPSTWIGGNSGIYRAVSAAQQVEVPISRDHAYDCITKPIDCPIAELRAWQTSVKLAPLTTSKGAKKQTQKPL
jgi:hypothetical protein